MVKQIACQGFEDGKLFVYTLDADTCDSVNYDAAQGFYFSFLKLNHLNQKETLVKVGTNVGGHSMCQINELIIYCRKDN